MNTIAMVCFVLMVIACLCLFAIPVIGFVVGYRKTRVWRREEKRNIENLFASVKESPSRCQAVLLEQFKCYVFELDHMAISYYRIHEHLKECGGIKNNKVSPGFKEILEKVYDFLMNNHRLGEARCLAKKYCL
ncbi:MAG: hypothetical protein PHN74_02335 [Candidatus Pacebacteria bacterium]|nr:hypothetical protein [Candidatus Paceibacterota bacterium]